ncbi:MAG: hypothetical protein IJK60_06010 [Clostridia bacterium]|nr:hypothetical protein [Clostridia bacterium]
MNNGCFDNSDEVYFYMDEPQVKQIDCEELEKEHGDEDPVNCDEVYCLNVTSWD